MFQVESNRKIDHGYQELVSILRLVKRQVFHFFYLYTTKIIVLKIFLHFTFAPLHFSGIKFLAKIIMAGGHLPPPCTLQLKFMPGYHTHTHTRAHARARARAHTHTKIKIYIYIHIYKHHVKYSKICILPTHYM